MFPNDGWALLFSHPKVFTPVCTTELGAVAGMKDDFRTAGENATARTVRIIGPDKRIKARLTCPMATGRNFDEILRYVSDLS